MLERETSRQRALNLVLKHVLLFAQCCMRVDFNLHLCVHFEKATKQNFGLPTVISVISESNFGVKISQFTG